MYLRMRLRKWDDIEATLGRLRVPITLNRSIGFMEVYETVEDMKKDYVNENAYVQVEEITNDSKDNQ